jgi:hypothetical protein
MTVESKVLRLSMNHVYGSQVVVAPGCRRPCQPCLLSFMDLTLQELTRVAVCHPRQGLQRQFSGMCGSLFFVN